MNASDNAMWMQCVAQAHAIVAGDCYQGNECVSVPVHILLAMQRHRLDLAADLAGIREVLFEGCSQTIRPEDQVIDAGFEASEGEG